MGINSARFSFRNQYKTQLAATALPLTAGGCEKFRVHNNNK